MGTKTSKRTLVTTLAVLGGLLLIIGIIALLGLNAKQDPYVQQQSPTTSSTKDSTEKEDVADQNTDNVNDTTTPESTIDPESVSTVDIVPMTITVSYVKGVGGFEYEVLRAANGTRYVEFRSPSLVGTKCTNDKGTFASIIANPTESESTGLAKTTTVDSVKYGLALADVSCTSNTEAFQSYQKSFSDAFPLLKKLQ